MIPRDALVADAARTIARGSKSFAAASRLFDRVTRERAWLLYAWCRACDDLADGQELGHGQVAVEDPAARIATIRARTQTALAGACVGDPPYDGLRLVVAETGLPRRFVDDHVAGFQLDADGWRPRSTDDLMRYCYHVAGVVGCMMAVVMGVPPDDNATLDRACDLGLAFQLANIARDVTEDARAGRCYLPAEWLAEVGVPPGELLRPRHGPRLAMLAGRLARLSARYEASARFGTPRLGWRSAWAVLAAADIYGGIARGVAVAGEGALDRRVTTGRAEKIAAITRAGLTVPVRARRYPPTPRDLSLWTRPRR